MAEVCEADGVDWSVYRGISDRPDEHIVDQAVFGLSKPDGSADPVAVAKYLARDPRRAKALAHLNRCMQTAARLAADAALRTSWPTANRRRRGGPADAPRRGGRSRGRRCRSPMPCAGSCWITDPRVIDCQRLSREVPRRSG